MSAEDVIKMLVGLLTGAGGVIAFLYLELRKKDKAHTDEMRALAKQYQDDLKAEHSQRLVEKDKATTALLEQSNRAHNMVDRLTDVFESMTGKRIQP